MKTMLTKPDLRVHCEHGGVHSNHAEYDLSQSGSPAPAEGHGLSPVKAPQNVATTNSKGFEPEFQIHLIKLESPRQMPPAWRTSQVPSMENNAHGIMPFMQTQPIKFKTNLEQALLIWRTPQLSVA